MSASRRVSWRSVLALGLLLLALRGTCYALFDVIMRYNQLLSVFGLWSTARLALGFVLVRWLADRARAESAGRGGLGRGAGGRRRWGPATRVLPEHVLAAPSVAVVATLSPRLCAGNGRTRGRLRASPGSSRCSLARRPLAPRADSGCAPLVGGAEDGA